MTIPGFWRSLASTAICLFTAIVVPQGQRVQGTPHHRTYFYVGGSYVQQGNSTVMQGAMYVEHLVPQHVTKPLPLLMIHGHGMTGTNFLNTPDGRPGWADYFLGKGYELFIVDQPARARSAYQQGLDGPQGTFDVSIIESHFTATAKFKLWPQAMLHTQWPGNGTRGDPIFDSFYASTVPSLVSNVETSIRMKIAGSALLDKIGPVNLLTHSQSGPLGWVLADSRPNMIKSIIALEPNGPPFIDAVFPAVTPALPFGLTEIPLQYDPPISSAEDLHPMVLTNTSLLICFQQTPPARKLANMLEIPILMITAEASYHAVYDGCTANYLQQAGVKVQQVNLGDVGIHGNGHMMFMEKNNFEIAQLVDKWITRQTIN